MQQPDYSISTPENVDLHLEIAGLGNRLLAQLVDSLINVLTAFAVIIAALITGYLISNMPIDAQTKTIWYGVLAMISIFIIFIQVNCYFIVFEAIWQGQTPGKKVAEIRVIEANGQPIGWPGAIIRNLIRMVDQILFLGLLIMLFDKNERRLGDMAAGTIVIREHKPDISTTQVLLANPVNATNLLDIGRVTPAEYDLIVDFLKRRKSLAKAYRPLVAQKLAKYFHEKLGSGDSESAAPEAYLEQVYGSYQARANE
ncbi:hypothetical protein BH11CYA1_BH11CYA1_29300 [soil metagenome]